MTPYQTGIAAEGLRDGRTILAWQIAAFERSRKLPKLETLLGKDKRQAGKGLIEALRREKAAHRNNKNVVVPRSGERVGSRTKK